MGVIAAEVAIQTPRSQIHFAAPFQNQVKEYLLPVFNDILRDCPNDLKPKWNPVGGKFTFPNGSFIKLCGCNNRQFDNLRGNRSDLFILDEARDIDDLETVVNDIALPQLLSSTYPGKRIIIPSTPPSTPDHPFKTYAEAAKALGAYSEFTLDETWYPQEDKDRFVRQQGGKDSTSAQREYYCKFVVDETLHIIPEWKNHPEFVQEVVHDDFFQFYTILEGMDVGYRDFTAWILGHYDFKNARAVIEHEIALRENKFTTKFFAEQALATEESYKATKTQKVSRISDNNNLNILADLSRTHKMPFAPVSKKNGKEWMVNQLRQFVGSGKLVVHPRCKMLIASLDFGIWQDNSKTDFARSKELGHYDFIDALVYMVAVLVPTVQNTNPIPPLYRVDVANTMFPNGIPKYGTPNPGDDIIRKMFPNPFSLDKNNGA